MAKITSPYPFFVDVDGDPLESGYIYIGQSGLNPEASPVTVYSDKALSIPVAQPIRTLGGLPVVSGTPIQLYTVQNDFSITIRNKNLTLVRTALSASTELFIPSEAQFLTVSDMVSGTDINGNAINYGALTFGGTVNPSVNVTYNNSTSERGGMDYVIKTSGQAASDGDTVDGISVIYVGGGTSYVAVMPKGLDISLWNLGLETTTSGQNITAMIDSAKARGARSVYIPIEEVAITGSFYELDGMSLTGVNTVITGPEGVYNGQLVNCNVVRKFELAKAISAAPTPASKGRTKLLCKQSSLIGGTTSLNSEYYSIFSPSPYGGIAQFELTNGVGASGSTDYGAPWDRLRVVGSWLYRDGFVINDVVAGSSGVTDGSEGIWALVGTDYSSAANYVNTGSVSVLEKELGPADHIEYNLDSSINRYTNVVLVPKALGDVANNTYEISINGQVYYSGTGFAVASNADDIHVVPITLPKNQTCTVRVTHSGSNGGFSVLGAAFHKMSDLPECNDVDGQSYFRRVFAFQRYEILGTQVGANIDSVLKSGSVFYGSYHGGDTSGQCRIYLSNPTSPAPRRIDITTTTNPAPSLVMPVGQCIGASNITIRYTGAIATTPALNFYGTWDFGVDGGCNVNCTYQAASGDVDIVELYTGMHGTSRDLNLYRGGSFGAADNTRTVFPNSEVIYQFGASNQFVKMTPQIFDASRAARGNQIRNSAAYFKWYYLPIESSVSAPAKLFDGCRFSFGCLYEYGNTIY